MIQISDEITDIWDEISKLNSHLLSNPYAPLIGLDDALHDFGLTPLPESEYNPEISPLIHTQQPSFKYLTEEILISLRNCLYNQSEMDTVSIWAEKLLRFCEIRFASLKKRAHEKWGDRQVTQLNMLHLSAFLLDYFAHSNDLRFLNTVLKLADIGWIIKIKSIYRGLSATNDHILNNLFQFRILLLTEHALNQLSQGEIE